MHFNLIFRYNSMFNLSIKFKNNWLIQFIILYFNAIQYLHISIMLKIYFDFITIKKNLIIFIIQYFDEIIL